MARFEEEHVLVALALREPEPLGSDAPHRRRGPRASGCDGRESVRRPCERRRCLGLVRP